MVAVTHDRYFLDNVGSGSWNSTAAKLLPYEGNYSTWLGRRPSAWRGPGQEGPEAAPPASGKSSPGCGRAPRPPDQEQGAPGPLRGDGRGGRRRRASSTRSDRHPPAPPRLGDIVVEAEHLDKGFGGRVLIKDLSFSLPRNGIVGVIGPNGVGKTTLFKTITGLESRTRATSRSVRRSSCPTSTRPEPTSIREDCVGGRLRRPRSASRSVRMKCRRAPTSARSASRGADQQKPSEVLSGGERNRLTLR